MPIHILALVGYGEHETIAAYEDQTAAEARRDELERERLASEGPWANRKNWENYDPRASYNEHYAVYELPYVVREEG